MKKQCDNKNKKGETLKIKNGHFREIKIELGQLVILIIQLSVLSAQLLL
jgi:hypothetical protein